MKQIKCQRIYDDDPLEGCRILVDRLWPRGIKKEDVKVDCWMKEIAPSNELRKWFSHIPEKYVEFKTRYKRELEENPSRDESIAYFKEKLEEQDVVLLYAAKNEENNNAVVLEEWLKEKLEEPGEAQRK